MVHVVVVMLSTITVLGFTEEWFMLLWLVKLFTITVWVWQRSGSCCCCYTVYHCCLRFDRGDVHIVVILYTIIVYSVSGVVHVGVILSTITVYGLAEEWFMLWLLYCLLLLFKVWQRSGSCCCYIVHYYCLKFDRSGSCCCYIAYHYCWFKLILLFIITTNGSDTSFTT